MKKFKIFIILSIIMILTALTACSRKNKDAEETTAIPTVTETTAQTESTETEKETETEPVYIGKDVALNQIQAAIGDRGYLFEVLDANKIVKGTSYYLFQISDNSSVIDPYVLVDKISGELLCYYENGTTGPFSEFPLYSAPNNNDNPSSGKITRDEATKLLSQLPAKTLGLKKSFSEYSIIEFDDWTTNVNNLECYGINVYEKSNGSKTNVGTFYVATDGSKMFRFDSVNEEFIELVK